MTNKNRVITLLDDETKEKIEKIADKEGRSVSNLIGFIIKQYINEHQTNTERENQ